MGRPAGAKNKRTQDMIEYAEADTRLSPAKAMIEYYMMNLEVFPRAKAAFPGMVSVKLARRKKALEKELDAAEYHALDLDELRAMIEYEVLQEMFPAMPRVVAMKEAAPYCHSKMPVLVNMDVTDNRIAERMFAAQTRLANRLMDAVDKLPAPVKDVVDVSPNPAPPAGSIAAAILRRSGGGNS